MLVWVRVLVVLLRLSTGSWVVVVCTWRERATEVAVVPLEMVVLGSCGVRSQPYSSVAG